MLLLRDLVSQSMAFSNKLNFYLISGFSTSPEFCFKLSYFSEPPIGAGVCSTLWGLFPMDCTHFYNCIDGVPQEVSCPEGLAFSQVNKTCDYPENVPGCEGKFQNN